MPHVDQVVPTRRSVSSASCVGSLAAAVAARKRVLPSRAGSCALAWPPAGGGLSSAATVHKRGHGRFRRARVPVRAPPSVGMPTLELVRAARLRRSNQVGNRAGNTPSTRASRRLIMRVMGEQVRPPKRLGRSLEVARPGASSPCRRSQRGRPRSPRARRVRGSAVVIAWSSSRIRDQAPRFRDFRPP